jgi:hypothetical protein
MKYNKSFKHVLTASEGSVSKDITYKSAKIHVLSTTATRHMEHANGFRKEFEMLDSSTLNSRMMPGIGNNFPAFF